MMDLVPVVLGLAATGWPHNELAYLIKSKTTPTNKVKKKRELFISFENGTHNFGCADKYS